MNPKLIFALIIYLVGLSFRLYQLPATSVYPDEITWMVKGKETVYALLKQNFSYFKTAWWSDPSDAHAIGWPLVLTNGLSHIFLAGEGQYSLRLFPDIIASRLPLVIFGPLTAVALYIFARHYLKNKFAFLIALGFTLNPITLALDRWLLHDSPLTLFSFLSLTTFLTAHQRRSFSLLPGVFLSLAFLTKPTGLLPAIVWLLNPRLLLVNSFSFLLATLLLWPQSWFEPLLSIPNYLFRQFFLSSTGDPIPNFYFVPTRNPHWSYYFFQLTTRTPPVILILAFTGVIFFLSRRHPRSVKHSAVAIATYVSLFLAVSSLVANKGGVRYLLPLYPWIYLVAGYGLQKINSRLFSLILIPVILFPVFSYHPDYYLYYNFLIGGPRGASRFDLIGPCLGSKQALEYLDGNRIQGLTGIIGCYDTGPYHSPRPQTKNWGQAQLLILELSYLQQHPDRPEVTSLKNRQLLYTVRQHGLATAWIYR